MCIDIEPIRVTTSISLPTHETIQGTLNVHDPQDLDQQTAVLKERNLVELGTCNGHFEFEA